MLCVNCTVSTDNPKFCSRSCSASYNNRVAPKRNKEGLCRLCGTSIHAHRSYCNDCHKKPPTPEEQGMRDLKRRQHYKTYMNDRYHEDPTDQRLYSSNWYKKHSLAKKDSTLRRLYNITLNDLDAMTQRQKGRCAICNKKVVKLHVDHCHETNKVRGLLCPICNTSLGGFRDSPRILRAAANYIERYK